MYSVSHRVVHMLPAPSPGSIARVRQRLYLVEDTVVPTTTGDSTLVRLSCVDDDNQGQPLDVLWERELDPEILTGEAWEAIATRGFDQPRLFANAVDLRHSFMGAYSIEAFLY